MIAKRVIRFLLLLCVAASGFDQVATLVAQENKNASLPTELLWPKGAPGAVGEEEKDKPKLMISLPKEELRNGTAIVVLPGGGYGGLAMGHEGYQIAEWLNDRGIAAFICDYRHRGKGYGHPAPLQDAQRAVQTVRARADEFKIDPAKIGIIGFSAGGHLAASTSTIHVDAKPDSADPIERVSSRPDFAILCYPVIAFDQPFTHYGSQHNLLGKDATKEEVAGMSIERRVTEKNPPTFLWHTTTDAAVPPQNSVVMYLALVNAKVPAEMMIFEQGVHGLGLAKGIKSVSSWPDRCFDWMEMHKLLAEKK